MTQPWKVLRLQSRYEFAVERQLAISGIEHYLPKREERRIWSDRVKKLELALFPNYIFVRTEAARRNEVFRIRGVLAYVRYEQRDATIREREMERIMQIGMPCSPGVQTSDPVIGQRCRVKAGVFGGQTGCIQSLKSNGLVRIEFEEWRPGFIIEIPSAYLVSV